MTTNDNPYRPTMTPQEAADAQARIMDRELAIMLQARKEYAPGANVFANFNLVADLLKIHPYEVIMTYALKHVTGIATWVENGDEQRDTIHGRIADARNFLLILAMAIESLEGETQ